MSGSSRMVSVQHQRAQMHPFGAVGFHGGIGVVVADIEGVVVGEAHHGHAVDFARHHHVYVGSRIGGNQAGLRVEVEILCGGRSKASSRTSSPRPRAGWDHTNGRGEGLVPRGHLLVGRAGGQAELHIRALHGGEREAALFRDDQTRQLRVRKGALATLTSPRRVTRSSAAPSNAPAPMTVTFGRSTASASCP